MRTNTAVMEAKLDKLIPVDDPHHNYNVTTNNFFLTFHQNGVPSLFIGLVGIRWLISVVGALLNSLLFWVFINNRKQLQGTCHMVNAANTFFTALFEFSLTIGFVLQLAGVHFMKLPSCFLIQVFSIFCRNFIISSLCAVAFDRFISVSFVPWHLHFGHSNPYRAALFFACFLHAALFISSVTYTVIEMPELREVCISSDDTYQDWVQDVLFQINSIILLTVLLFYFLIWIVLRVRKSNTILESNRKLAKSLAGTSCLIAFGWLSYNAVQAILLPHFMDMMQPIELAYATITASTLPYIAMGLNAPMLIFFGKDYRTAFFNSMGVLQQMAGIPTNKASPSVKRQFASQTRPPPPLPARNVLGRTTTAPPVAAAVNINAGTNGRVEAASIRRSIQVNVVVPSARTVQPHNN